MYNKHVFFSRSLSIVIFILYSTFQITNAMPMKVTIAIYTGIQFYNTK